MNVLIEMVTRLSAVLPVLSSWENCALNIIERNQLSSAWFICKTSQHCPSNDLYKLLRIPAQTLLGLENDQLPVLDDYDLVFLVIHEDPMEWKNETVQKYLWGGNNFFKIVVVSNMLDIPDENFRFMKELFGGMWKSGIANGAVLLKNDTTSQLFTYVPYRSSEACGDTSPVMIGTCSQVAEIIFNDTFKVVNLNSCPLTISMTTDKPWLELEPFRGPLQLLLEEVRSKMNFTINSISPALGGNGGVCQPNEFTGTKGDVVISSLGRRNKGKGFMASVLVMTCGCFAQASGKAHLAFGTFNRRECSVLEYIDIAFTTCLSWCIPLISAKDNTFTLLARILRPKVWAAYIATIVVVVVTIKWLSYWTKTCVATRHIFYVVLVVFSPMPVEYRSSHIRIVLIFWFFTCLVLRTAYEGELKSQSAVPVTPVVIKDLEGIVTRVQSKKFKNVWATASSLGSLKTIDDPYNRYLYKAARMCSQENLYYNIVQAALQKDRAVFTTDQRCRAIDAELRNHNGPPRLHAQTGGCIKLIHLALFLTTRGSPFRRTIADIQRWTYDTGLFTKWTAKRLSPVKAAQGGAKSLKVKKVLPALYVLLLGCAFAFAAFLFEITAHLKLLLRLKSILRCTRLRFRGKKSGSPASGEDCELPPAAFSATKYSQKRPLQRREERNKHNEMFGTRVLSRPADVSFTLYKH